MKSAVTKETFPNPASCLHYREHKALQEQSTNFFYIFLFSREWNIWQIILKSLFTPEKRQVKQEKMSFTV